MASILLRVLRFSAILTAVVLGISALLLGLVQAAETQGRTIAQHSLSVAPSKGAAEACIRGVDAGYATHASQIDHNDQHSK
jgi:hypothetical protein